MRVSDDGEGVVSLAGAVALRMLADRSGLTGLLSSVFARLDFQPVHDRGRLLTDLAVALGAGARDIVDVEALRSQGEVFGPVASDTTVLRALHEIGDAHRTAIGRVRAAARAHIWSRLPHGVPESRFAGGVCQPGMLVLRVDGTIVVSHSTKDRARGTFKKTFGHHPLGCWLDNTGELLSLLLRPGNAGSNTAADLITVIGEALAQIPADRRDRVLVSSDAAGASHGMVDWLVEQKLDFSIGFDVDTDVRAAIVALRKECWVPALDNATGSPRHDADVADITTLMRTRIARHGWPADLVVTVRRIKLAPGEQPTLFHLHGYKYSCFVSRGRPLPLQRLDARHRAHARVEDGVRTSKDTGLGHLPSKAWDVNTAWCHAITIAADLLAWYRLLGLTGPLAKAEPKTLRFRLLQVPARLTRGQRHRWLRIPKTWPWARALADSINNIRRIPVLRPG
jgi:Transposase DDE domain group 1